MVNFPEGYFNRFDPTKNYEKHVFRAGRVLQGAEVNEVQDASQERLRNIADVLFRDGAVIRDAGIRVDPATGVTNLESGAVYLRGAVRGVPPAVLTIPVTGLVQVGIRLRDTIITELEDGALRDPAIGAKNYGEPGAARLQVTTAWGVQGDGQEGEFYPVYNVVDGIVESKDPPPAIDAVALAIASYDRQSAGGYYVASGLRVTKLDDEGGNQVYSVAEGVARVMGREVNIQHARRVVYAATPDLKQVLSEPRTAVGGTERVTLNHSPIAVVDQVLITAQKVVTMTHGAFAGAVDALPDSPILSIVAVNQGGAWNSGSGTFSGGTTYEQGSVYKLTADAVDWSLSGAEPAPGSTYQVVYRYLASVTPTGLDDTGFTITGAVAGTVTQVSYRWERPRIDRLCLNAQGLVQWVQGVPHDTMPLAPAIPDGLLSLATITQTWTTTRAVASDGVRVIPMAGLEAMQRQIDDLFNVVSDQQLRVESAISDPTTKRGIFTDPFANDDKRDQGVAQTAAIVESCLTLPIEGVAVATASLEDTATLPLNNPGTFPVIAQPLRTSAMLVNPYQAFTPIPAQVQLQPATDFWTEQETTWASAITRRFEVQAPDKVVAFSSWGLATRFLGVSQTVVISNSQETLGVTQSQAQFLRQIVVSFTVGGFGPGEWLDTITFDGRAVTFTA